MMSRVIDRTIRPAWIASAFTVFVVLMTATSAFAQDGLDLLREAEREVAELEFERAAELLREVVVLPELPPDDLVRARSLLGKCDFILGNLSDARLHYRQILDDRPTFELPPEESPKIKNFFLLVKTKWNEQRQRTKAADGEREPPVAATGPAALPPGAGPTKTAAESDAESDDDGGLLAPILIGSAAAVGVAVAIVGGGTVAAVLYLQTAPTIGTIDARGLQ